jgi:hypothetical protein
MVYWASQWVIRKKPSYLTAALITWGVGMYVFMEIAPALFILPVVWFLYRPPLRVRSLLLSGVTILAVWYPYLRFEYGRNFVDLKAQVSRRTMLPANYRDSWCDPHLVLRRREVTATGGVIDREFTVANAQGKKVQTGVRARLNALWGIWNWVPANFEFSNNFPGSKIILALLTLTSLYLISISPGSTTRSTEDQRRLCRTVLGVLAAGFILLGLLFNEFVIAYFVSQDGSLEAGTVTGIRWFQAFLFGAGIALMVLKGAIAHMVVRLRSTESVAPEVIGQLGNPKMFCISLLIPWVVLLLLVENGEHLERFWWIWPFQVITLAALVTYIPTRLRASRAAVLIASACLAAMVLNPSSLLSRVQRLSTAGWAGSDAVEMRLADFMAQQVAGKDRAAIGYQIYNWPFMVAFNAADSRYKVGAEFDLLYSTIHRFSNADQCAEGISAEDEFRIVQISPTSDPREGYFDISLDKSFRLLQQFGPYQVFQR